MLNIFILFVYERNISLEEYKTHQQTWQLLGKGAG